MPKGTIVAVSGGFDPPHSGHLALFWGAKNLAGPDGTLVVIINNDYWLEKKKGYVFQDENARANLLSNLRPIDRVIRTGHGKPLETRSKVDEWTTVGSWQEVSQEPSTNAEFATSLVGLEDIVLISGEDMSVCSELAALRPDIFANGGDRFADNIPEHQLCTKLGIEMVFNVGGGKADSSSDMVRRAAKALSASKRRQRSKFL